MEKSIWNLKSMVRLQMQVVQDLLVQAIRKILNCKRWMAFNK